MEPQSKVNSREMSGADLNTGFSRLFTSLPAEIPSDLSHVYNMGNKSFVCQRDIAMISLLDIGGAQL